MNVLKRFFGKATALSFRPAQHQLGQPQKALAVGLCLSAAAMLSGCGVTPAHDAWIKEVKTNHPHQLNQVSSQKNEITLDGVRFNDASLSKLLGLPVQLHIGENAQDFETPVLRNMLRFRLAKQQDLSAADMFSADVDLRDASPADIEQAQQKASQLARMVGLATVTIKNKQHFACSIYMNKDQLLTSSQTFLSRRLRVSPWVIEKAEMNLSTRVAFSLLHEAAHCIQPVRADAHQHETFADKTALEFATTLNLRAVDDQVMQDIRHVSAIISSDFDHSVGVSIAREQAGQAGLQKAQHQQIWQDLVDGLEHEAYRLNHPNLDYSRSLGRNGVAMDRGGVMRLLVATHQRLDQLPEAGLSDAQQVQKEFMLNFVQAMPRFAPNLAQEAHAVALDIQARPTVTQPTARAVQPKLR